MKEGQITYVNDKGEEMLCEILFTFHSDEFNRSYVLFYDESAEEENGQIDVLAAAFEEAEGASGELFEIQTEEEWELIQEMLTQFEEGKLEKLKED